MVKQAAAYVSTILPVFVLILKHKKRVYNQITFPRVYKKNDNRNVFSFEATMKLNCLILYCKLKKSFEDFTFIERIIHPKVQPSQHLNN